MIFPVNLKLPPGLEPAPTNDPLSTQGGAWLAIDLDGGRVYLDDDGNLFARAAHAAIRDRFVDALNASGPALARRRSRSSTP